ncbi:MAG: DUF460 domain-containing protein [Candidatus Micrarchaeota archaeon]
MNYLLVGIDPGTTVGYAIFDLDGNLLSAGSKREIGKEELIKIIRSYGTPSLFAVDVSSPHELAKKLAAAFNARIFSPDKNLTQEEKRELTPNFKFQNEHEMDAAASALKAFHQFENRFRQIGNAFQDKEQRQKLKHAVLQGISVSNALAPKEIPLRPEVPEPILSLPPTHALLEQKNTQIHQLFSSNNELKKALALLEAENKLLLEKLRAHERGTAERISRDKEMRARELKIMKLEFILQKMRKPKRANERSKEEQSKSAIRARGSNAHQKSQTSDCTKEEKNNLKAFAGKKIVGLSSSDLERILQEYQQQSG